MPTVTQPGAAQPPPPFHLLAKPTGAVCNLDCAYCFFLSKELLYPGSRFRMADELLQTYIRQLIEAHSGVPVVEVAWQGGEPTLMGLDFFRRSVELVDRHLAPGQEAVYTIQTNGTKLDAAWAAFLGENDFLVGISIDGPREIHDTYRVTRGGRGSFDAVMRGLGHLREAGVRYNVLTTVHAANETRGLEVYRFLRDECGARFMQFIPVVERISAAEANANTAWSSWRDRPLYTQSGDGVTARSVSPEGYGRFLVDVFEEWVRRDIGEVYVQMFDATLANWVGEQPGMCVHCETCGSALALEHTGDVYSCDHFVEPRHLLGNISEHHLIDLVSSEQQQAFGRAKRDALPAHCLRCDVRFACHGGCPKDRFSRTPDGEPGLNYLCPSFTLFFSHVGEPMRIMAVLLRQNRAPSEITRIYAARDARRGRNEPCPCGGGRKWKQCHGRR
ncbi:MAG TPA: anaerobic sulfatase maturase [Solirubrobacteraceae bacterium]|nr:anaerobic sulfatase maturase [Solirubrobacteraceae bacterium]